MIPKNGLLPDLDSLIDTEESEIELTDADFDNFQDDSNNINRNNLNESIEDDSDFSSIDSEDDIQDLTDADFENMGFDDEDNYNNGYSDEYDLGAQFQERDEHSDNNEFLDEIKDTDDNEDNEDIYTPSKEIMTGKIKNQKPPKIKNKKKKKSFRFSNYKKTIKIVIVILLAIVILVFVASVVNKSLKKEKNTTTDISNKVKVEESTVVKANDKLKINIETLETTIKLDKNSSGIIQSVYKRADGKIIVCESVGNDFSKDEEKTVQLSCYNILEGESISDMKEISKNFIEE